MIFRLVSLDINRWVFVRVELVRIGLAVVPSVGRPIDRSADDLLLHSADCRSFSRIFSICHRDALVFPHLSLSRRRQSRHRRRTRGRNSRSRDKQLHRRTDEQKKENLQIEIIYLFSVCVWTIYHCGASRTELFLLSCFLSLSLRVSLGRLLLMMQDLYMCVCVCVVLQETSQENKTRKRTTRRVKEKIII